MEDRLTRILGIVNDWLKFAEIKNGALLTLATGLALGLTKTNPAGLHSSKIQWCYVAAVVLASIAAVISLVSFIPVVTIPWLALERKTSADDNLYFFGDISAYAPSEYVLALLAASGEPNRAVTKLELNVASQIIVNSRLAARKFSYFTFAARLGGRVHGVWLA